MTNATGQVGGTAGSNEDVIAAPTGKRLRTNRDIEERLLAETRLQGATAGWNGEQRAGTGNSGQQAETTCWSANPDFEWSRTTAVLCQKKGAKPPWNDSTYQISPLSAKLRVSAPATTK